MKYKYTRKQWWKKHGETFMDDEEQELFATVPVKEKECKCPTLEKGVSRDGKGRFFCLNCGGMLPEKQKSIHLSRNGKPTPSPEKVTEEMVRNNFCPQVADLVCNMLKPTPSPEKECKHHWVEVPQEEKLFCTKCCQWNPTPSPSAVSQTREKAQNIPEVSEKIEKIDVEPIKAPESGNRLYGYWIRDLQLFDKIDELIDWANKVNDLMKERE